MFRSDIRTLLRFAPAIVLAAQAPAFGQAFELVDLGNLGGNRSNAFDVNDAGQVVGFAHNGTAIRPFRITPVADEWFRDDDLDGANDLMLDLGVLDPANPPNRFGIARGIDQLGQVVGSAQNELAQFRAFFWEAAAGMIDLGSLGWPSQQNPARINENGEAVGTGYVSSQAFHGFQWDAVNGLVDLGTLPGATWSSAADINDAGRIVGSAYAPGNTAFQPVTWSSAGGTLATIGTFGGTKGAAYGINESEQIVGFATYASSEERAFLLTPPSAGVFFQDNDLDGINDLLLDLGELDPANVQTWALDLDEDGNAVGFSASTLVVADRRAFLWNGVVMVDLNDEIAAGSGWVLREAKAINAIGQIVGVGLLNGEERAFLLNPDLRWYVHEGVGGANTGRTWANAFVDLQSALAVARAGDQIWVAEGTYEPTAGSDRTKSFVLVRGVALYGGFAGGETELDQRAPSLHPTVLSGDLADDDGPNFSGYGDNSLHVVRGSALNLATVLDGFVVRGGNANLGTTDRLGGGVYIASGSPTIANCIIEANQALGNATGSGGGVWAAQGSPLFFQCVVRANLAEFRGGGAMLSGNGHWLGCTLEGNRAVLGPGGGLNLVGLPRLEDCTIRQNVATNGDGGGAYCTGGPTFVGCVFDSNQANVASAGRGGGALFSAGGSPTLSDCSFLGNRSRSFGGALFLDACQGVVEGSFFSANSTTSPSTYGGAIYARFGGTRIANCDFRSNASPNGGALSLLRMSSVVAGSTFHGNSAQIAGAIRINDTGTPALAIRNCTLASNSAQSGGGITVVSGVPTVASCIVWGNSALNAPQLYPQNGTLAVTYSTVQGGWSGAGNSGLAPRFVALTSGDLHLLAGSPAIDSGSNGMVPVWLFADRDGRVRRFDHPATPDGGSGTAPLVDRGAYEFASPLACSSDCDGDGTCDPDEIGSGNDTDWNANGIPDGCEGLALDPDVDADESVTLLPAGGGGNRTQEPVIELTNQTGADGASVVVVQSGVDLHPGAGGYGALGKTITVETSLADGEFFLRVSVPFTLADLAGAPWSSVDLLYFEPGTGNWELAPAGNTVDSPGHAGPLGDRDVVPSPTIPPLSSELGDYGVYWNSALGRGFAWANVDHTTDFCFGLAFGTITDCNENGLDDLEELASGTSDCNQNGWLDECELALGLAQDCDGDGLIDDCQIAAGGASDCNENGVLDACDLLSGASQDRFPSGGDGVPDECQARRRFLREK